MSDELPRVASSQLWISGKSSRGDFVWSSLSLVNKVSIRAYIGLFVGLFYITQVLIGGEKDVR